VLQSHRNCHRHPVFPATRTKNLSTEKQTPNDAIAAADQYRSQIVVLWKPGEIESADDSHEREDRRLDRNPSMT